MNEINMNKNYDFVNPKEIMQKIKDPDFCNILGELMPIYSTSDLMREIADLSSKDKNVNMIGIGSFSFKDSYIFNYLPKNKKETTQIAYQRGTQIGSKLMEELFICKEDVMFSNFTSFKASSLTNKESFFIKSNSFNLPFAIE